MAATRQLDCLTLLFTNVVVQGILCRLSLFSVSTRAWILMLLAHQSVMQPSQMKSCYIVYVISLKQKMSRC